MMNEKQLAERLRDIANNAADADVELRLLADELDPPKPELKTGIFVYWRFLGESVWDRGFSIEDGGETVIIIKDGTTVYLSQVEWKPARILGPRQVAVDIPPVVEWSYRADKVEIVANYLERDSEGYFAIISASELPTLASFTRAEAERMEASNGA
jgi:hypothetical protein